MVPSCHGPPPGRPAGSPPCWSGCSRPMSARRSTASPPAPRTRWFPAPWCRSSSWPRPSRSLHPPYGVAGSVGGQPSHRPARRA